MDELDGKTIAPFDDLAETMYAAPGIGLAATSRRGGAGDRPTAWREGRPGTAVSSW